ncbi:haloacid dehalogenase-like hydrolase, partial [Candidatus Micrarchaeota archaeon]|nr:haloacid dehalogenase-like hydrolase [Candidatus Micrarchaeota archaeon]
VREFEQVAQQAEFFDGAKEFFSSMQELGAKIIFLTAAYEPMAEKIAQRLEVNAVVCATKVRRENGFVTGFEGPVMDGKMKEKALVDYCSKNGFSLSNTIGLGDSKTDLDFLNAITAGGGESFLSKTPDYPALGKKILQMNWSEKNGVKKIE